VLGKTLPDQLIIMSAPEMDFLGKGVIVVVSITTRTKRPLKESL
jgi:hypothetical protein